MKLIKPYVEFIDPIDRDAILQKIEKAGRTCYKSESNITPESASKFVSNLVKRGHGAMLEHASLTVKFVTDRGCYTPDTEILTQRGWVKFPQLNEEDKIITKDDKNFLKAVPYKFISYDYKGEIYHFHSTSMDLQVTPDHRMWVFDSMKRSPKTKIWKFIPAEEMNTNGYKLSRGANRVCRADMKIQIGNRLYNSRDFFYILGLWITDGSISRRKDYDGFDAVISQKKKPIIDKLKNAFDKLNIGYNYNRNEFAINDPALEQWLYNTFIKNNDFHKTYYIRLPRDIIENASVSQLGGLIEGLYDGDGTTNTKGTSCLYSVSYDLLSDVQECLLYMGLSGTINQCTDRRGSHIICGKLSNITTLTYTITFCKNNEFFIRPHRNNTKIGPHCKRENYEGKVYCVELPKYHRLYVRRNGLACWCGNCSHEIVRHRMASYAQESTRYVRYGTTAKEADDITFIIPSWASKLKEGVWRAEDGEKFGYGSDIQVWCLNGNRATYISENELYFLEACWRAEAVYNSMMKNGMQAQQARAVLPNALKTEIVMTANLREWAHFINLRSKGTTGAPHPDMKVVADMVYEKFHAELPEIFN